MYNSKEKNQHQTTSNPQILDLEEGPIWGPCSFAGVGVRVFLPFDDGSSAQSQQIMNRKCPCTYLCLCDRWVVILLPLNSYAWDFCCHINEKCYMIIRRWTGTAVPYMFVRSKHAYSLSIASRGCKGTILDRENRPEHVLRCNIGKSVWETAWNCYVSGMSGECQGSFMKGTSRRVVGSLIKRARCFVLKYFFCVTDIFAVHFLQETKVFQDTGVSKSYPLVN